HVSRPLCPYTTLFLSARDVVADLAVRVQHHVPQEHVRLGIDGLPMRVVLGEALDEPEGEGADGAVQAGAWADHRSRDGHVPAGRDRTSTRLNSSHVRL